jgi:hypothetical protein
MLIWRALGAVLTGVIAWFAVATLLNLLLRVMLPGYAAVEPAMTFTLAMQVARLALGLLSSICAGAACAAVAHSSSRAPQFLAGLMLVLFLPVHYGLWAKFPVWYHLFFLITLAPAVLLGAALVRPRPRAEAASRPPTNLL